MTIDLHLHSSISDGLYAPEDVLKKAKAEGLKVISLTDHDSYSGYERLKTASTNDDIRIIRGVELSSTYEDNEIHILGYFKNGVSRGLKVFISRAQSDREGRISEALVNLKGKGIELTRNELMQFYHGESIGRNHLAQLLVSRGYADSFTRAFQDYLKYEMNIVPRTKTLVEDAIKIVKDSGGVSVWAHPPFKLFDKCIKTFMDIGLDGVEAYNSRKSNNNSFYYHTVAEKFGLFITAGSDWHGFPEEKFLGEKNCPVETLSRFIERVS